MPNIKVIISSYINTHKKSWFIELLPWVERGASTTLYPYVYLSRSAYESIYSDNPDPYKVSTLIHGEEHIARIKELGVLKWYFKYFISRKFRFEEELAAMKPQLAFLKGQGLSFDLERAARSLSSWIYLWPVNYDYALKKLTMLWDNSDPARI